MLLSFVIFALALIVVIKSSDMFLDGAVWLARRLNVPDIIIGATIVSCLTTLPEMIISITSSVVGLPGLAFGNAIGSIAFNTCVVMVIPFFFLQPPVADRAKLRKNYLILGSGLVLALIFAFTPGGISGWCGVLLVGGLVVYMAMNVKSAKLGTDAGGLPEEIDAKEKRPVWMILSLLLGAAGTVWGSQEMVEHASLIALNMGVSEVIIGITMAAVGSSMPELATAVAAVRKRAPNISIGNIVGANVINITGVIGISALVAPIALDTAYVAFHLIFALMITSVLAYWTFKNKERYTRRDGALLLLSYAAYMFLSLYCF